MIASSEHLRQNDNLSPWINRPQPAGRSRRHRRPVLLLASLLLLLAVLAVIWGFLIEPAILTTTRLTVTDPDLPASWDGRVIAFFSDVHVGPAYGVDRLSRLADAVTAAEPDLVLFGGDLIDHRTPTDDAFARSVSDCLSRMRAPWGQYAIAGNHDNRLRAELRLMAGMLEDGGFQLLTNQSVLLDGIWLAGLDESYFGKPDAGLAFSGAGLLPAAGQSEPTGTPDAGKALFRLLMMHQPDVAADLPAGTADLLLSGHSHNGQITFLGRAIITVSQGERYPYGLYHLENGSSLAVSRGLGTVGLAARFCAPPELILITLRRS